LKDLIIDDYKKANTLVFETHSMLFAAAVCDTLEMVGIPAMMQVNGHYCVNVPADLEADSHQLLYSEQDGAEIARRCG
jgi:hypothetical protein